jgi:hypothetical protein
LETVKNDIIKETRSLQDVRYTVLTTHGKVLIPIQDRIEIIKDMHAYLGHPGIEKLYSTINKTSNAVI